MLMKSRLNTLSTLAAVTLGSLCLAPGAKAQITGLITDTPTITVSGNLFAAGYCTPAATACGGNFGAISSAITAQGLTIAAFVDLPGPPKMGPGYFRTQLAITGFASDPGQNWLSSANCGGVIYEGAASPNYSFSNGRASWFWNARDGAQPAFKGHSTVTCNIYSSGDSGWVRPKYQVVGLTYAPPGSRSSANYSSGFKSGTSTSHASSFTAGISERVQITTGGSLFGIFGGTVTQTFTFGWNQQQDSSNSLTISQQTSNGLIVPGPAASAAGVDHDFDTIYVWLNPEIFLMIFPANVVVGGYGYDARDTVTGMDVIPLTVGQLKGTQPIGPQTWARLNRTWAPELGGLTSVDFQVILHANPFVTNPAYNPNTDPNRRYELPLSGNPPLPANLILNYLPAPPGGQPTGQTYSASYSNTTEAGKQAKDTYSTSYSVDGAASFNFLVKLNTMLSTTLSLSYSNQWSSKVTNEASQEASFTIFPPVAADNYVGPTAMQVWKDNVYGTFMFFPQN
jgi:hypothetical protein